MEAGITPRSSKERSEISKIVVTPNKEKTNKLRAKR